MDYAYEILKLYRESPPHIKKMMRLSAALSAAANGTFGAAQAGEQPPDSCQPPNGKQDNPLQRVL